MFMCIYIYILHNSKKWVECQQCWSYEQRELRSLAGTTVVWLVNTVWLVVSIPLKNMSSSMGRIIPCMKWKITNVWNHQPAVVTRLPYESLGHLLLGTEQDLTYIVINHGKPMVNHTQLTQLYHLEASKSFKIHIFCKCSCWKTVGYYPIACLCLHPHGILITALHSSIPLL